MPWVDYLPAGPDSDTCAGGSYDCESMWWIVTPEFSVDGDKIEAIAPFGDGYIVASMAVLIAAFVVAASAGQFLFPYTGVAAAGLLVFGLAIHHLLKSWGVITIFGAEEGRPTPFLWAIMSLGLVDALGAGIILGLRQPTHAAHSEEADAWA